MDSIQERYQMTQASYLLQMLANLRPKQITNSLSRLSKAEAIPIFPALLAPPESHIPCTLGTSGSASNPTSFLRTDPNFLAIPTYEAMPPKIRIASDSHEPRTASTTAGRRTPVHRLLGGGRVADVVLWRNKRLSAAILGGATLIWFLFEVAEYHFVTLLCHISIIAMLVVFIWSTGAYLFDRSPPDISEAIPSERAFNEAASVLHDKLHDFISALHNVACGRDLKLFLLAIASLWILSVVGSYCSSMSLLYFCFLCIEIVPALYERYETEVDHLATKGSHDLKKFYEELDDKVLRKIPRGPVKEKKFK